MKLTDTMLLQYVQAMEHEEVNAGNYSFSQTSEDVFVVVDVPVGTRVSDLSISIDKKNIKVSIASIVEPNTLLLGGKLFSSVVPADCMWSLVDNKSVEINLVKRLEEKWDSLLVGGVAVPLAVPVVDTGPVDTRKVVLTVMSLAQDIRLGQCIDVQYEVSGGLSSEKDYIGLFLPSQSDPEEYEEFDWCEDEVSCGAVGVLAQGR